jgi:hypothetical protein
MNSKRDGLPDFLRSGPRARPRVARSTKKTPTQEACQFEKLVAFARSLLSAIGNRLEDLDQQGKLDEALAALRAENQSYHAPLSDKDVRAAFLESLKKVRQERYRAERDALNLFANI